MKDFPNGFTSWAETHFEIVTHIAVELLKEEQSEKINELYEKGGTGGMYELAEDLTDKFEAKYVGIDWENEEVDYFDTVCAFFNSEMECGG